MHCSAQTITILLSVCSASKHNRIAGECHEMNDESLLWLRAVLYCSNVLTKDLAVTCSQFWLNGSFHPWQFGCSNGRRSAINQLWLATFNGCSDLIVVDVADDRPVDGVDEWFFGEVLVIVKSKPVYQRSSSIRLDIRRSVGDLIAGMLR